MSESTQCQVKAFLPSPSLSLVRQWSCGHSGILPECSRLVWREEAGQRTGRLAFFHHAEQCWDFMQMLSCLGSSWICLHIAGKWWWWVGVKVEDMLQLILGVLNDPSLVRISQMLEVWPGTVWTSSLVKECKWTQSKLTAKCCGVQVSAFYSDHHVLKVCTIWTGSQSFVQVSTIKVNCQLR